MKSLVTGGTGFVGGHLVRRLREMGQEVCCIVRDKSKAESLACLGAEIIAGDLTNNLSWCTKLDDVSEVYHLAGVTRARTAKEYYLGNQLGTQLLLEACRDHCSGLRRFLHVSSLAAAGPSEDGHPLGEDEPFHPVSHYGRSKMMSELEVLRLKNEMPITIIRPSIVYGPQERDMYEYFRMIQNRVYPLIGSRPQWLNLVYASDLVDAIVKASRSDRAIGETYFIGSEQQYTAQEIGDTIAKIVGRQPFRVYLPEMLVLVAGAVAGTIGRLSGQAVFFNLQKAREATQQAWVCSVQKAKEHFGYCQTLTLEEAFRNTYRWYIEHGWLKR